MIIQNNSVFRKKNAFISLLALSLLLLASPVPVSAHSSGSLRQVRPMLYAPTGTSALAGRPIASRSPDSLPKTLCGSLPNGDSPGGVYKGAGGAFVEDWSTGNLVWCSGGTSTTIAMVPSGGSNIGYYGLAGIVTTTQGLVLILSSWGASGLWICFGATSSGCTSQSSFISLPSSFCSSEPSGICNPDGSVTDKKLNLYYVDILNEQLVECTHSSNYQSCTVEPASSAFSGFEPVNLAVYKGEFFVSDLSCTGNVWAGTKSSMAVLASIGDSLQGIAVSKSNVGKVPEVYVGDDASCSGGAAKLIDITDGGSVPSGFSSSNAIIGIDSKLQFASFTNGAVYQTKDTS